MRMYMILLWMGFLPLYLISAGSLAAWEIVAGGVVAVGATLLALRLQRSFRRPMSFRPAWLLTFWRIVPAIAVETLQLYGALFRRLAGRDVEGVFIEHAYAVKADDPYATMRFAVMAFGVCVTPNSYLVSFDRKRGRVTLRQLAGKKLSSADAAFLSLP